MTKLQITAQMITEIAEKRRIKEALISWHQINCDWATEIIGGRKKIEEAIEAALDKC